MRDRVVRGGAIAAAGLVVLAAACSSSGATKAGAGGSTLPTVTVPPHVTGPGGPSTSRTPGGTRTTGVTVTDATNHTAITDPLTGATITEPPPTVSSLTQPTVTTPGSSQYILQWKFAVDYRTNPGTNPFANYLGGPKVWSLREGTSRNGNYTLLPNHSSSFGDAGVYGWYGSTPACTGRPAIAANTADAPATVCNVTIPAHAAWVYPSSTHMAVVQWTSLFDANVRITSGIADLDPSCGHGVRYYIDKGTTELNAMTLTNGNAVMLQPPITTPVTFGQNLNFIVDSGADGNSDCDTTQLVITIERLQGS